MLINQLKQSINVKMQIFREEGRTMQKQNAKRDVSCEHVIQTRLKRTVSKSKSSWDMSNVFPNIQPDF